MHHIAKGRHTLQIERTGAMSVERLTLKAIPELMHCGLGFNPQIKSYGLYDMDFLKRDILPNVTTLIVPHNIKLSDSVIEDWHRQGKRFVAEVGINSQAKTADEHAAFWTDFFHDAPFIDGIIINEFIVNRPVSEWVQTMTPDRLARMDQERAAYELYSEAFKKIRADTRFANKSIYAYVGGSGKKLNQEIIGTNVIRTMVDCGYFVAPERYLHEMSTEKGSHDALQAFLDGLADWEAKEPGVKKQMVITFGLFSMPPGGINKQPNVDYHVWMDQQMNLVANDPTLANIAGSELVDLPFGRRRNGPFRRQALPPLCPRGKNKHAHQRSLIPDAHPERRLRTRHQTAGPFIRPKTAASPPKAFRDTAGSRADTWDSAAPPTLSTSATPSSG